jgi:GntR family transcriptional regulator of arabinose operon
MKQGLQIQGDVNVPLYSRIAEHIRCRIEDGEFAKDDRLPTNIDLAKSYDTTPQTIRQSLGALMSEGLVSSTRGRGTFVLPRDSQPTSSPIVVIQPDHGHNSSIQQIVNGVIRSAQDDGGRKVHMQVADYNLDRECEQIAGLMDSDYAGAIIIPVLTSEIIAQLTELRRSGFPYVLIVNWIPGLDVDFVGNDDEHNGQIIGEHLLSMGYEDIAFLGESMHVAPATFPRIKGLRKAMQSRLIDLPSNRILMVDHDLGYGVGADPFEAGYQRIKELIASGEDLPRAIYASHDYLASGALRACLEAGIDVPGQVAIIGSGDDIFTRSSTPQLSTVSFDHAWVGAKAFEVLQSLIRGKSQKAKHHYGYGKVVVRGSTDPQCR